MAGDGLDLRYGVTFEQWRQLLRESNLADALAELKLRFSGSVADVLSTDLPIVSTLTKLTHLWLEQVRGSLSFLQNLTQLQKLRLSDTQVSGSISFPQNLYLLQELDLDDTKVNGSLLFLEDLTLLQTLRLSRTQVSGSLLFLQNLIQLQVQGHRGRGLGQVLVVGGDLSEPLPGGGKQNLSLLGPV